jgi:hypothetical protein
MVIEEPLGISCGDERKNTWDVASQLVSTKLKHSEVGTICKLCRKLPSNAVNGRPRALGAMAGNHTSLGFTR